MEKVRLAIQTSDSKPFIDLLNRTYEGTYSRDFGDHYLFIAEVYSFIARYQLTTSIVIEKLDGRIIIDILVTGGGIGRYSIFARSPYREAKTMANTIIDYCNNNGIQGHQVKGESTL